ncbi:hypothetical protein [Loktanella salsilacus]|jgi:hypothetical protein|uniref:Uncharacterized protein n=1 Tax=Loktanella salsilacus TaxID=195913 RepID=A0A1I4EQR8_9RHOB|nr:hypothetical protein [Loktanella salsilacus]MBU0781208.1 hypothetical protein [Alphaproteobacteria bacterium]MBU1835871.1 hypothetical protein [Alphaproteobacteria bacterium]UTH45177.1 hypothetical protein KBK07_03585 [Loktanella salsilacus]UTH48988.1 hypothetical protein KBW81_04090 [Loktanella salsilacus]SFL07440.1 hypothetical protein SAMN04488004_10792 [Loktanella salsilacus]|tara:strand:- start:1277 stop:1654 length:378 start_codon:yes stop_codon:yes gene_type:complete
MSRRPPLVLIWAVACIAAVLVAFGALVVMIPSGTVSYATEMPRSAVTAPMIAVVVFWGIVRACGVPLDPMKTYVFGALAVYGMLYLVGRVLAVTGISPPLVLAVNLIALMSLAWWWIKLAAQARR